MLRLRHLLLAATLTGCASAGTVATAATPGGELPRTHRAMPTTGAITPADLMSRLYVVADDSMLGREATTRGNVKTTAQIDGKPITIGVNAYIAK